MNMSHEIFFNEPPYAIRTVQYQEIMTPQFMQNYNKALAFSNLEVGKDIHYRNVKIYEKDHLHQIYTMREPASKLPHLVLLHGFGGTGLTFVRLFQHLHLHFQVHALDAFGIGLSSIGKFHQNMETEEIAAYYIEAIEEWVKAVDIQSFVLAGHSFGAFLSTLYLEKYPIRINKLILLSPAGTILLTEEQLNQKYSQMSCGRRMFTGFAEKMYNLHIRPSKMLQNCLFGGLVMNRLLGRLKLTGEQGQAWRIYLLKCIEVKQTSEEGFYKLFSWPLQPFRSIQQIVEKYQFKIPIEIYFGDEDWMEKKGAMILAKKYENIQIQIIEKAGHQLIFDNAASIGRHIIHKQKAEIQIILKKNFEQK